MGDPYVSGLKVNGSGPAAVPVANDGLSVPVTGTVTATGGATAANQTNGAQKTQVVDAADVNLGTNTNPIIETTPTPTTFTPTIIRGGHGGAAQALPTDNDPNTTAPDATNSARFTHPAGGVFYGSGGVAIYAIGGTSCTVRCWWYDDTNAYWTPLGNVQTLTSASTNFLRIVCGAMVGAKFFVQIVTNTGVTELIWHFS